MTSGAASRSERPALTWLDGDTVVIDGVEFLTLGDDDRIAEKMFMRGRRKSTAERFVVLKTRSLLEQYAALFVELVPSRIVELGIFKGGSTVFLLTLTRPTKLVALDYEREPVAALTAFREAHGPGHALAEYYGVDQADSAQLRRILDDEFGENFLDLVVDDASHDLDRTRSSFNTLFPRLRPGGLYVIEDWAWSLKPQDLSLLERGDVHVEGTPLHPLVFEFVLACATTPVLFDQVACTRDLVIVRRGPGETDGDGFDVRSLLPPGT